MRQALWLLVGGCTCAEEIQPDAPPEAPPAVERVGQAAPLPALPAPKIDGCKRTFMLPQLQALGNRALFDQSGLGNASPVLLLRDGRPLRPHVQPDRQSCDDTFIHGAMSVLAQVQADGAWTLGWSPDLPALTTERNKEVPLWWVYPGTTLRVRGEGTGALVVFAEAAGAGGWPMRVEGAEGELAAGGPATVRGSVSVSTSPWLLEVQAPPDGAALAVRGVVMGLGEDGVVVLGQRPPAGVRLVGDARVVAATAKGAPPPVRAAGAVKADTKPPTKAPEGAPAPPPDQPHGRIPLGALGELAPGVIVDRAGVPGCSPLRVLEDGRAVGAPNTPVKEVLTAGRGAWAIQPGAALVTASDGSDPASNGRAYTLALQEERACRGAVWLYPGDEIVVSEPVVRQGAAGATQLALAARPLAGATGQQPVWVRLEAGGVVLHDAAVTVASLPGGAVLPLREPFPAGATSATLTLSSTAEAPFLLITLAELRGAPEGAASEVAAAAAPKAERAAAAGPSTAAGTVTFDLSALRADPKDLLRLVQLDATPGDSSVTPANGGLRFEATVAGSSRICTGRFGVRGPGVARAHVRVPTLAPGAAKWQTLRLDAGFFGDDHKPVLEGGKPASSGVDVPASAAWAWIELPIEPPEGTAEVQVCLRFAKSTGVAEIDRLEAKGGAGR